MSITHDGDYRLVHYPADPDRFVFDEEVSAHCEDFFHRAIPLYQETQDLVASLIHQRIVHIWCTEDRPVTMVDVGASSGSLLKRVWDRFNTSYDQPIDNLHVTAVDSSPHMVKRLHKELPHVMSYCMDALTTHTVVDDADIATVSYLVQFLPPANQKVFWKLLATVMSPGSVAFVSGKERPGRDVERQVYDSMYNQFRLRQGYSQHEIDCKTQALKNSMWPPTREGMVSNMTENGFMVEMILTQYLSFTCYMISRD